MASLSRRGFLRCAAGFAGGCALAAGPASRALAADDLEALVAAAPVARWWTADGDVIRCGLCARACALGEGERGMCRARIHRDGTLRSLVYGRPISIHVDPIEKKPFFHFLPGQSAYSMATSGCPLRCRFCQNWSISQARPEDYHRAPLGPAELVRDATRRRAPIIAYTYNEPTVFAEYLVDIARAGREDGLRNVLVSCGYAQQEPLAELCGILDAVKIDLKGFSEAFYRDVCGAELAPVLRSIRQVHASGTWLELVNLVVPTLNDSEDLLRALARWVVRELSPDVPVHFTRFHPDYQLMDLPPTPVATLERARAIALEEGLRFPYIGNVPGHDGNHTWCPGCGGRIVERRGFFVLGTWLDGSACAHCGREVPGVWA